MQRDIPTLLIFVFIFNVQSTYGQWDNFRWISSTNIKTHLNRLVPLGVPDGSGEALHFCRTKYENTGHYYPGKFSPSDDPPSCTITMYVRVYVKTSEFEVLYTPEGFVQWAPGNGGIPEYAFAVGTDAGEGRYMHLGRVRHNGKDILARVLGYRSFFTDGNGREIGTRNYEVLILTYAARRRNILTYAPY